MQSTVRHDRCGLSIEAWSRRSWQFFHGGLTQLSFDRRGEEKLYDHPVSPYPRHLGSDTVPWSNVDHARLGSLPL